MKNMNKIKSALSYLTGTLFAFSCIAAFSVCITSISEMIKTGFTITSVLDGLILIAVCLCSPYILFHLRKIADSSKTDLFIRENITRLKKLGNTLLIFSGLNLLSAFVNTSIAAVLMNLISIVPSLLSILVITLICYILSDALEKAIEFKEENEFTI